MSLQEHKLTDYAVSIASLPDKIEDRAQWLKQQFDARTDREVKEKHNSLIDALEADLAGRPTNETMAGAIDAKVVELGAGDMAQGVYDPAHRRQDVFAYADAVRRYAQGAGATLGPAAQVEADAGPNRLACVTVTGFTTQTGSGDPSPVNIRKIENAGLYNRRITVDQNSAITTSGEATIVGTSRRFQLKADDLPETPMASVGKILCNQLPTKAASETYQNDIAAVSAQNDPSSQNVIQFRVPGCKTIEEMKAWLTNNPLDIIYLSNQNTGKFYTGVTMAQDGSDRCEIIELQAPLHRGDTLATRTEYDGAQKRLETHTRKTLVLDGTEKLTATTVAQHTYFAFPLENVQKPASVDVTTDAVSNVLRPVSQNTLLALPYSFCTSGGGNLLCYFKPDVTTVQQAQALLAGLHAAGTPLTVEYPLAQPEVYASDPVELENPTGACTLAGESGTTLAVALTPPVGSVNGKSGAAVTLTKADVGLANVDNTPDNQKFVQGLVTQATDVIREINTGLYYYPANTPGAPKTVDGLLLVLVYGDFGVQLAFPTNGGVYFRWAVSDFSEWIRLDS